MAGCGGRQSSCSPQLVHHAACPPPHIVPGPVSLLPALLPPFAASAASAPFCSLCLPCSPQLLLLSTASVPCPPPSYLLSGIVLALSPFLSRHVAHGSPGLCLSVHQHPGTGAAVARAGASMCSVPGREWSHA